MDSPPCPFCNIAETNPPIPVNKPENNKAISPGSESAPTAHMILSTDHVLAFLDIMPLTRGHVLVAPRRHYDMLGDLGVNAGQEVCLSTHNKIIHRGRVLHPFFFTLETWVLLMICL